MGFLKLIVQVFFVCFELTWVGGERWEPEGWGARRVEGPKGGGPEWWGVRRVGGPKGGGSKGGGAQPRKTGGPKGGAPEGLGVG